MPLDPDAVIRICLEIHHVQLTLVTDLYDSGMSSSALAEFLPDLLQDTKRDLPNAVREHTIVLLDVRYEFD